MTNTVETLMHEALDYEAEAFDGDAAANAADLVDWFAEWRERAKAVVRPVSERAGADASACTESEEPMRYLNRYWHCGEEWEDTWSCMCNDKCPVCGAEIEPVESEAISEEDG